MNPGRSSGRYVRLVYCTAHLAGSGPPGSDHSHDNDGFVFLDAAQSPPPDQRCVMVAVFGLQPGVAVDGPHLNLDSQVEIPALTTLERPDAGPPHRYTACAGLHYSPNLPPAPNNIFSIAGTVAAEAMGIRLIRRFDPPAPVRRHAGGGRPPII